MMFWLLGYGLFCLIVVGVFWRMSKNAPIMEDEDE